MPFSFRWLLALGTTLFFASQTLRSTAQDPLSSHFPPPISSLRLLTRNSGYIFDGTVLSVERVAETEPGGVWAVQITFRVEQAIRGVRNGQVLTVREWAGLWNSGARYRSGERLLLFLYPPSKLGLTSPVGGPLGRFAVDRGGNVIFDNARLAALFLSLGQTQSSQTSPDPALRAKLTGQNRLNSRTLALAIQSMARE
jgi:hypothetical protein